MDQTRTSAGWPTKPRRADGRRDAALRLLSACLLFGSAQAAGLPEGEPKLLPPEQAFRFSAQALDARTVEARFDVADGYYLYRDKLAFTIEPATASGGDAVLPAGKRKHDEFFGDVETYRGRVAVRIPLAAASAGSPLTLKAASQGCADAGVCYPPTIQQVRLTVPRTGAGPGPIAEPARKKGLFE